MVNDPLFCHNLTGNDDDISRDYLRRNKKPTGVCTTLGDLPLEHFKGSDLRDWVESVKCAADKNGNADNAAGWYGGLFQIDAIEGTYAYDFGDNLVDGDEDMGDDMMLQRRVGGITANPDVLYALQDAWDPLLVASLHNDKMPVNATVKSANELKQAYQAEFPQTWKNLLTTEDVAYARKQVTKEARRLIAEPRKYKAYLSKANDHYAEHLTDRALSKRSDFIAGGLLEQALSEMQNPSAKGKRTKAAKRVKEFIDNFDTTAEYFKRENPELQDNAHVLREILRSYIQPMAATDAQQLEQAVEAKVMNKETITPDMLNALRNQLHTDTSNTNLTTIAEELQQAAANMGENNDTHAYDGQDGQETAKIGGKSDFGKTRRDAVRQIADAAEGGGRSIEYIIRRREDVNDGRNAKPDEQIRLAFMNTKITKENLLRMAELDIVVPFGFMLTRP